MQYLLGIDNGGTVTKAAIYDLKGKELAVSGIKTKLLMPFPGFTERDSDELWAANIEVIKEAISKSGINPKMIAGVAVTGHGNGMYLVDENGRPVCNGIISTDTRAGNIVEKWCSDKTADRIREKTLQAVYPGQPPPLLFWLKANKPDILKRTKWILSCKDYIRSCLTGKIYTDFTDASVANLVNAWTKDYDLDLLKEFGLEDVFDKLPPIKGSSDICGYVTKEAACLTGLAEGTPVAGGMCDMDACAIATGIVDEELLCIIAGTWSINQYISAKPVTSKDLFLSSIYCIEGFWLNSEASATSASNLEWFISKFLEEEKGLADKKGLSVYDICNEMVEETKPEDSTLLFLPFLFGTNVHAHAKSCFIGLSGWHKKAEIIRAVYEGIVFSHLYHINKLLKFRNRPKSIRISGGVVRSKVWVQMFSDITQTLIEVVKGSEMGTLGSAICAAVATGCFDSYKDAVEAMVDLSFTVKPDESRRKIYNDKYALYEKATELLNPLWDSMKENSSTGRGY